MYFLDRCQRGPIRSVLLVIIGWLVTQFSQKRLQGFFWFFALCWGTIKVEKWLSWIFEKSSWFGDICKNISKLAQNQTLWYLVGWLVGNAVFSETAPRIFLIFSMELGDYKGRKVTDPDFWKKFLIWRYISFPWFCT